MNECKVDCKIILVKKFKSVLVIEKWFQQFTWGFFYKHYHPEENCDFAFLFTLMLHTPAADLRGCRSGIGQPV